VSFTLTVKVHGDEALPAESVAVQLTVVMPLANVDPEAGVQTGATNGSQLSCAAISKLTTAEH
jgi:hypothetical protein